MLSQAPFSGRVIPPGAFLVYFLHPADARHNLQADGPDLVQAEQIVG